MSNLIGTTVMCPECGAWNVPGHSCRDKNPFQDIANALAREVRETDALKLRLTVASTLERQLVARVAELEDQNLAITKENNDLKAKFQNIHDAIFNALKP